MINTFCEGQVLNHFSCFSWISFRYSRGISLSSALFLILVRSQHFQGVHRRQIILVFSIYVIDSKLPQSDLKTQYYPQSIQPKSLINSEKTYLSARILLSEILIIQGYLWMASCNFCILVNIAQIWKVNPHLLGQVQYFSSMFIFLPFKFCHSATGYSIHLASGTFSRRISKKVDLPHPMFPSIVQQQSFFENSGLSGKFCVF